MGAFDWLVDALPIGPGRVKKHGRLDVNRADPRITDPSVTFPAPHAASHGVAGTDPVTLAQSQITGLVTALATKVDTDDSRLTDARPPTAHHATHEDGGSDELELAQSQITGLLTDLAALAASIPEIPAYGTSQAYHVLGVGADGSLGWVPAVSLFDGAYDFGDDYDTSDTYD